MLDRLAGRFVLEQHRIEARISGPADRARRLVDPHLRD